MYSTRQLRHREVDKHFQTRGPTTTCANKEAPSAVAIAVRQHAVKSKTRAESDLIHEGPVEKTVVDKVLRPEATAIQGIKGPTTITISALATADAATRARHQ